MILFLCCLLAFAGLGILSNWHDIRTTRRRLDAWDKAVGEFVANAEKIDKKLDEFKRRSAEAKNAEEVQAILEEMFGVASLRKFRQDEMVGGTDAPQD